MIGLSEEILKIDVKKSAFCKTSVYTLGKSSFAVDEIASKNKTEGELCKGNDL